MINDNISSIDKLIQWMDLNYGQVGHSEVQAKAIELSLDETLKQEETVLNLEEYLDLLGIDKHHAEGVTIWDTLQHNGYKIVKYK